MRLCLFQLLNTGDASGGQFSDSDDSDLINLFHLKRRVLPGPTGKTPGKLKSVPNSDSVLLVNLTVNNTPKEAVHMCENHGFVLLKLELVFLILLRKGKISSTQFRLNEKRNLVCVLGQVHSDRKPDTIATVNLPIQGTLRSFETDFSEFIGLRDC